MSRAVSCWLSVVTSEVHCDADAYHVVGAQEAVVAWSGSGCDAIHLGGQRAGEGGQRCQTCVGGRICACGDVLLRDARGDGCYALSKLLAHA